jgi:hypothetical protein
MYVRKDYEKYSILYKESLIVKVLTLQIFICIPIWKVDEDENTTEDKIH